MSWPGADALPGPLHARRGEAGDVGLILADTKFELGFVDGELVVCDEVITPDSSRIWPADDVRPARRRRRSTSSPSRLADAQEWDRTPPPPPVPDDVVAITSRATSRRTSA
jgi:phosphoribosylaminoimidazole-succinocarboxamide synthase